MVSRSSIRRPAGSPAAPGPELTPGPALDASGADAPPDAPPDPAPDAPPGARTGAIPETAPDATCAAPRPAYASGALIRAPGDIIDPAAVRARIDAAAATAGSPDARKAQVKDILRAALDSGHAAIRESFEASPRESAAACRSIAWLTDEIVRLVMSYGLRWLYPLSLPTTGERLTAVAVGGYGRYEMAPHSDVDLMFLVPMRGIPWAVQMIESAQHMLYDLHLKVGVSTRSVDECLQLAKSDITIRTALMESRYVCGDKSMHDEMGARLWTELFSKTGPQFVEAKLQERDQRHQRHGGSRYLLEPNVKESKGGLRDLQTLYWIAKYLYHADTPRALLDKGVFDEHELQIFEEAQEFLWTVRCHLHYIAGRANDHLTFDQQVEVARRLGYEASEGQRAVERFMQQYFRHAKNVGELTRIFIAGLEASHVKKRPGLGALMRAFNYGMRRGDNPFTLRGGRLALADEDAFAKDPVHILRMMDEGLRVGALLHPDALRKIAASLDLIDDRMRADPDASRIFRNLLLGRKDPERALRRLNETGFLGAYIPEFGRIVAMMQFNMYHRYTVDEHTIMAVGILSQIENGDRKDGLPVASRILAEGVNREALYLAVLLHDIGKGRKRDHSEVGAELALKICRRLGLDEAVCALVEWLVRHHLLMSDTAQKRDISDPATVRAFADEVRSPEKLKLLLVLTVCDIMAVGPNVWNNWKAQLLRQLYRDTRDMLTGGDGRQTRAQRAEEAQDALRAALTGWAPEDIEAEVARHYAPYWLGLTTEMQASFARLARAAREDRVESHIVADPSRDATRGCFYMSDHPGVFSRLAGALALAGANVVDARVYTTSDGFTCAAFWFQDNDGSPYDAERLDRMRRTIDRTMSGDLVARDALKPRRRVRTRESKFRVPTRIMFDNDSADLYTVIEVDTRDRVGLLYDLTRALAACNVSIFSAIIATYGEQAVDVFYAKDLFGLKIRSKAKMHTIETRLRDAIENAKPEPAPAGTAARGGAKPAARARGKAVATAAGKTVARGAGKAAGKAMGKAMGKAAAKTPAAPAAGAEKPKRGARRKTGGGPGAGGDAPEGAA